MKKSNIITITTDWGIADTYVAIFKAMLWKYNDNQRIVDISHLVRRNDITDAAYHIKNSYHYFPKGTVHIVDVSYVSEIQVKEYHTWRLSKEQEKGFHFTDYLAFEYDDHYFLCENNGIIVLICEDIAKIKSIVQLPRAEKQRHLSFSALDFYVKAASILAQQQQLHLVGTEYPKEYIENILPNNAFVRGDDKLIISVIHIDVYGNLMTNLSKDKFEEVAKGRRKFTFSSNMDKEKIKARISLNYMDIRVNMSSMFFVFGINGYMEIGMRNGSLAELCAMNNQDFRSWNFFIEFDKE